MSSVQGGQPPRFIWVILPQGIRCRAVGRAVRPPQFQENAPPGGETVIGVVVVALTHLAQQHWTAPFLHGEVVVEILMDVDALAGGQTDPGTV